MTTTRIEVKGLRELGVRLQRLSADVQQKTAHGAVLAGANLIKKRAIALAPISDEEHVIEGVHVKPGNLKKNIISKRVPKGETIFTSEYVVTVRGKAKHGYASRYGSMQEFGTVRMQANPFMRPALDSNKHAAVEKIKQILLKRIEKAEKGTN